jgi:hypothetical protein
VRGVSKYGKLSEEELPLDMEIVKEAARILFESEERLDGCAIDFGVIKKGDKYVTVLVEVNDGVFTGFYEGVEKKEFTEMVRMRWW